MPVLDKIKVLERILKHCKRDSNGCLIFTGYTEKDYGKITIDMQSNLTHRYIMWIMGEIELNSEFLVLHKNFICKSKACCEYDHLYIGTHSDNEADKIEVGFEPFASRHEEIRNRTHCNQGHKFTKANTLRDWKGYRRCRECHRLYFHNKRNKGLVK